VRIVGPPILDDEIEQAELICGKVRLRPCVGAWRPYYYHYYKSSRGLRSGATWV
jgi:hypothetical protein